MSDDHKAALARGRESRKAVEAYITALAEVNKPKPRGRQKTAEQIEEALATARKSLAEAGPMEKLVFASQEITLEKELAAKRTEAEPVDLSVLEAGFIEYGREYAEAKGIVYGAWRQAKVPRRILQVDGITDYELAMASRRVRNN